MVRFDLSLVVGLLLLIYAGFCMVKGGTHVRGKGWVSKYTHPFAYRVNQIFFFLFGFSMIISNFIFVK